MTDDEWPIKLPQVRPVGALGMTVEELDGLRRTKKWPRRQVQANEGPPGLSLSSLPSREYLRGYFDASRSRVGAKGKITEDTVLVRRLLEETGGNVEHARTHFILERAHARLTVEQPRARLTVRSTRKDLIFQQTDKGVIDLTPEKRSVFSKRFTRAMKKIRT